MQPLSVKYEAPTSERLVALLVKRLRQHALWDVLLLLAPPLSVAADCFGYLYGRTWITPATLAFAAFIVASLTLTAVIYGYRSAPCSARLAARLIDQRTEAADRFITLTTLEPGSCAPSLLGR